MLHKELLITPVMKESSYVSLIFYVEKNTKTEWKFINKYGNVEEGFIDQNIPCPYGINFECQRYSTIEIMAGSCSGNCTVFPKQRYTIEQVGNKHKITVFVSEQYAEINFI